MNVVRFICLTIVQLAQTAWLIPRLARAATKQRRRLAALEAREAERIDRIRNPSKYLAGNGNPAESQANL